MMPMRAAVEPGYYATHAPVMTLIPRMPFFRCIIYATPCFYAGLYARLMLRAMPAFCTYADYLLHCATFFAMP